MYENEFTLHVFLILQLTINPRKRIILDSYAYSDKQQIFINSLCKNTANIIGQLNIDSNLLGSISEIREIIESHPEPYLTVKQLQYHVLWNENRNKN